MRLGADESLVGDLDGEHARMLLALDAANAAMQTFRVDPSSTSAGTARTAIANLRAVLVEHLEHEERDLEPFAAARRDSPEIKAAQQGVRNSRNGTAGTFFGWLTDAIDDDSRAILRHEIPAPMLFVLTRVGGRDYRRRIASVLT